MAQKYSALTKGLPGCDALLSDSHWKGRILCRITWEQEDCFATIQFRPGSSGLHMWAGTFSGMLGIQSEEQIVYGRHGGVAESIRRCLSPYRTAPSDWRCNGLELPFFRGGHERPTFFFETELFSVLFVKVFYFTPGGRTFCLTSCFFVVIERE